MPQMSLLCCIVNHGKGSKVLKIAKSNGVSGGTIVVGKGAYHSKLLDLLDINDVRKEIVFMAADADIATTAAAAVTKQLQLRKKGYGIAFQIPICNLFGAASYMNNGSYSVEAGENMYQAIFTITDRGRAVEVIDAANAAGAKGGTIINARGSGIHETEVLFAMPVEPEREIVLTIVKSELVEAVTASIREKLSLDQPGKGILFVTPISDSHGLYDK